MIVVSARHPSIKNKQPDELMIRIQIAQPYTKCMQYALFKYLEKFSNYRKEEPIDVDLEKCSRPVGPLESGCGRLGLPEPLPSTVVYVSTE